jgi:salicylate hydroxylase
MASHNAPPRIAVVGAGIGGLILALALRQRGIAATLYEQAQELAEIGAAVALSANGTRELERLGVLDAVGDSVALAEQHVVDGPGRDRRDRGLRRFPDWYGWIHGYDAREAAREALVGAGAA